MVASSFLNQPTCYIYPGSSYNPQGSKLSILFRRFSSEIPRGHPLTWRFSSLSCARSMTKLVKRSASRDRSSNGGSKQEAFVNGSPELQNDSVVGGGIEAIVNRLSKWIISVLFAVIVLLRHDSVALWAVIGTISNSALSVLLKHLLNQERPAATLRSDPGMPSTHAQSISFISVFTVLSVLELLGTNGVSLFLSALILVLSSYFIWLRVSQKLHTTSQVVVGAIVGSSFCILWYKTWNSLLLEAFESSPLLQASVFLVAASFTLGFGVYVLLDWFRDNR